MPATVAVNLCVAALSHAPPHWLKSSIIFGGGEYRIVWRQTINYLVLSLTRDKIALEHLVRAVQGTLVA